MLIIIWCRRTQPTVGITIPRQIVFGYIRWQVKHEPEIETKMDPANNLLPWFLIPCLCFLPWVSACLPPPPQWCILTGKQKPNKLFLSLVAFSHHFLLQQQKSILCFPSFFLHNEFEVCKWCMYQQFAFLLFSWILLYCINIQQAFLLIFYGHLDYLQSLASMSEPA